MNNSNLEASTLLNLRPILLLNKSLLSIPWIDSLVSKSPSLIASKKGGKVLPAELWDMIIDFAIGNNTTGHDYILARPAEVQPTSNSGAPTWDVYEQKGLLSVLKYKPYRPKGLLCHVRSERSQYLWFLRNPDTEAYKMKQFPLPVPYRTGQTITFALPKSSRVKVLFADFGIRELIARLQRGQCSDCNGVRVEMFRIPWYRNTSIYDPCVACLDESDTPTRLIEDYENDVPGREERLKAYGAKLVARQKELGYLAE